jgi:hypothetical protein
MSKFSLLPLFISLFGVLGAVSSLQAQTFGTKFVCCRVETTSGLGNAGCTKYTPALRDRALTQADAYARCVGVFAYDMKWATHQCPATSCSGSSTPSTPRPTPAPAPAPEPTPARYQWNDTMKECSNRTTYLRVANRFCGKASRQLKIIGNVCLVFVEGKVLDKQLNKGEEDCPN